MQERRQLRPQARFKKRVKGDATCLRDTTAQDKESTRHRQPDMNKHTADDPTPPEAPAEASRHINLYEDRRCQEWLDYCPDITPKDNRCFKDMKSKCTTPNCPQIHSKFNRRSSKACLIRLKRKEWCEAAYTPEGCRSNHYFKHTNKGAPKTSNKTTENLPPTQVPDSASRESTSADVFTSITTSPRPQNGTTAGSNPDCRKPPENPLHTAAMSELTTRMTLLPSLRTLQASQIHTRGDLTKALKALTSHAKAETAAMEENRLSTRPKWQSTCWPCMLRSKEVSREAITES